MFNAEEFLKENLLNGFENGSFTGEQINIFAFNYKLKGLISEECFNELCEAVTEPTIEEEILQEVEDV